jgi:hypothetical protein
LSSSKLLLKCAGILEEWCPARGHANAERKSIFAPAELDTSGRIKARPSVFVRLDGAVGTTAPGAQQQGAAAKPQSRSRPSMRATRGMGQLFHDVTLPREEEKSKSSNAEDKLTFQPGKPRKIRDSVFAHKTITISTLEEDEDELEEEEVRHVEPLASSHQQEAPAPILAPAPAQRSHESGSAHVGKQEERYAVPVEPETGSAFHAASDSTSQPAPPRHPREEPVQHIERQQPVVRSEVVIAAPAPVSPFDAPHVAASFSQPRQAEHGDEDVVAAVPPPPAPAVLPPAPVPVPSVSLEPPRAPALSKSAGTGMVRTSSRVRFDAVVDVKILPAHPTVSESHGEEEEEDMGGEVKPFNVDTDDDDNEDARISTKAQSRPAPGVPVSRFAPGNLPPIIAVPDYSAPPSRVSSLKATSMYASSPTAASQPQVGERPASSKRLWDAVLSK